MSKISKKERAELVQAGRACAEKACTDETNEADANGAIEYPESYAVDAYMKHTGLSYIASHEHFAIFKAAFAAWVHSVYDSSKVD